MSTSKFVRWTRVAVVWAVVVMLTLNPAIAAQGRRWTCQPVCPPRCSPPVVFYCPPCPNSHAEWAEARAAKTTGCLPSKAAPPKSAVETQRPETSPTDPSTLADEAPRVPPAMSPAPLAEDAPETAPQPAPADNFDDLFPRTEPPADAAPSRSPSRPLEGQPDDIPLTVPLEPPPDQPPATVPPVFDPFGPTSPVQPLPGQSAPGEPAIEPSVPLDPFEQFRPAQPTPSDPAPVPASPTSPPPAESAPAGGLDGLIRPGQPPAQPVEPSGDLEDLFRSDDDPTPTQSKPTSADPSSASDEFEDLFGSPPITAPSGSTPPATPEAAPAAAPAADDNPFGFSARQPARQRLWTDDSGLHQVHGRLHQILVGKVRLLKANGRFSTVPLSRLSAEDYRYVQTMFVQYGDKVIQAEMVAQR